MGPWCFARGTKKLLYYVGQTYSATQHRAEAHLSNLKEAGCFARGKKTFDYLGMCSLQAGVKSNWAMDMFRSDNLTPPQIF